MFAHGVTSAQVSDDFSDGDFTSGTVWTGDDSFFVVESEVLRSNIDPGDDAINYHLSTPNTLLNDVQWEFWINLNFATSGANYADVYLMSENPDLSAAQNGYFIRFGETEDEISFYKLLSGSEIILIDGPDGQLGSTNNIFRVRMTRTSAGEWSLDIDEDDTGNFTSAGSIIDNDITTTTHFGIRIQQSSAASPVNNHFFDDFVVDLIPVDETPPDLLSATAVSSTEVLLEFSEPLDESTATPNSNYFIDGGVGIPAVAVLNSVNPNEVSLTLSTPLSNGQDYGITVSGVADLVGNTTSNETAVFTFFIPDNPDEGDVIFNELFPDPNPSVGLPEKEFIELYNRSELFFDLEGWTLVNSTTERGLTSVALPPNEYLILCDAADVDLFAAFGMVLGIPSFTALSNSGDSLTLLDADGEVLDIVSYTGSWYQDPEKDDGGFTLEKINPTLSCSGSQNWIASNDPSGGTPGMQNSVFDESPDLTPPSITSSDLQTNSEMLLNLSEPIQNDGLSTAQFSIDQGASVSGSSLIQPNQVLITFAEDLEIGILYTLSVEALTDCEGNQSGIETIDILIGDRPEPGDLVITELMADPIPAVGYPEAEYFELFNKSEKTIELQGCEISGIEVDQSVIMSPGQYLIFTSDENTDLFTGFSGVRFLDMSTSFLTNGGRELVLTNPDELELDFVEYSDDWYNDPEKEDGGFSLELINPFLPCSGEFNWTASNNQLGGTPAFQNSVFNDTPDQTPPEFRSLSIDQGNVITIRFSEPLDQASVANIVPTFNPELQVAAVFPVRPEVISIELIPSLEIGVTYNLSLSGILDCSGNNANLIELEILVGRSPVENEILISELMVDPAPSAGLPEAEYFELYNNSDAAIELKDCNFSGYIFEESFVLSEGEYAFFTSISNQILFLGLPNARFLENFSTSFFTNSGKELVFQNPNGVLIDQVNYSVDWYNDTQKEDGGFSLERINLSEPCRGADNWDASNSEIGGTPGQQNSVFDQSPDEIEPKIKAVFAQSENLIEVRLNEVLDSLSIFTTDISVSPDLVTGAILNSPPDYNSIFIEVPDGLVEGVRYTLTISGISDCSGNLLEQSDSFPFALQQEAEDGDLLINEVLFNPRTSGRDYVEIYNTSDKNIGLQNWRLQNGDMTSRIISKDPIIIYPGQHLALTDDVVATTQEYPLSAAFPENFLEMESLPSYNNGDGTVILADRFDQAVDRFDYLEEYHFPLLSSVDGVSLERLSYTRPTNEEGNWSSASEKVGFATPGYVNSQFLPEGRANAKFELQDEVFSPDNDGFEDVLLINYALDRPDYLATIRIFDRRGRVIRGLTNNLLLGTDGTIAWDGTTDDRSKARIGPHIVLVEIFSPDGDTETFKIPCVVAGKLAN